MILRPSSDSYRVIGKYSGKVIVGVGFLMAVPLIVSLIFAEWEAAIDFVIAIALSLVIGFGAQAFFRTDKDLTWGEGLVVSAGSWIWAVMLAAVPYWLSGHYSSFVDACFDTMSGFTTTGLLLVQDLDHVSYGLNMWRHLLTYAGGQGIVVIALTFLFKGTAGAYKLYVGEGKDERLMPNVIETARAIWLVSIVYLIVGSIVLWVANMWLGMAPVRGFLFGTWTFMGAWSTGGFFPMSYNTMYMHSFLEEIICISIMIAGSMNFALHWAIWTGKRKEISKNIEIQSFTITLVSAIALGAFMLAKLGIYGNAVSLLRKVNYTLVSAHTTTGFSTVYSRAFVTQWGPVGLAIITMAMMIGGSACSTAGGIKNLRVGLMFKSFAADVKKTMMPETALMRTKYHHIKDSLLSDDLVKTTVTIGFMFLFSYLSAGFLGVFFGYDFLQGLFEGVSALSATGLSCGLTSPTMPEALKVIYIIYMWLGRLEFVSAFAVGAHLIAVFKGK